MEIAMNKLLNKVLLFGMAMLVSIFTLCQVTAYALSARIAFSDPSTSAGSEVDITMKITSLDGGTMGEAVIEVGYDTSYLEFLNGTNASKLSEGTVKIVGKTVDSGTEYVYTLKFKAIKSGETNLTVTSWGIYDANNNMVTLDKKGTSKITISGEGEATPESEVAAEGETISETEVATDGEVAQTDSTEVGTAQTGIVIDNIQYELATDFDSSLLPESFEKTEYTYQGQTVAAGRQAESSLILMYLLTEDGSGNLFFYEESSNTWMKQITFTVASKNITIIPLPMDITPPIGFSETTLDLNGDMVKGWIWAEDISHDYAVVYGMNIEGEKNFYRYDLKEKTIQRYFEDPSIRGNTGAYADMVDYYKSLKKAYDTRGKKLYIATSIAGVLFLLLIYLTYKAFFENKPRSPRGSHRSRRNTEHGNNEELKKNLSYENKGSNKSESHVNKINEDTENLPKGVKRYARPESRESSEELPSQGKVESSNEKEDKGIIANIKTVPSLEDTQEIVIPTKIDKITEENISIIGKDISKEDEVVISKTQDDKKMLMKEISISIDSIEAIESDEDIESKKEIKPEEEIKPEKDIENKESVEIIENKESIKAIESDEEINFKEDIGVKKDIGSKKSIKSKETIESKKDIESEENINAKENIIDTMEIEENPLKIEEDISKVENNILDRKDNNIEVDKEKEDAKVLEKEDSDISSNLIKQEQDTTEIEPVPDICMAQEVQDENTISERSSSLKFFISDFVYQCITSTYPKFSDITEEEKAILEGVPSLADKMNLEYYDREYEVYEDNEEEFYDELEDIHLTHENIASALEEIENLEEEIRFPIDEDDYEIARANEIKLNGVPKFQTREF